MVCRVRFMLGLEEEDVKRLQGTEKRMIRMMCGKILMDKYRSEELRKQVGVKDIG